VVELSKRFVCVRITGLNGLDLSLFEYDFDVTLMMFFMGAGDRVYARYGGRDHTSSTSHHNKASLLRAMRAALERHQREKREPSPPLPARIKTTPEDIAPLARDMRVAPFCVRCHLVNDYRHEAARASGTHRKESIWVFPPPDNVGLVMDVDLGDTVKSVKPGSPADKAGLKAGDRIRQAGETEVLTYTDLQWALHRSPTKTKLAVAFDRAGAPGKAELELDGPWRETPLGWRKSFQALGPQAGIWVRKTSPEDRRMAGLPADAPVYSVWYVDEKTPAEKAGVKIRDWVVAIDGKPLPETSEDGFRQIWPGRHDYGSTATLALLRAGKPMTVKLQF